MRVAVVGIILLLCIASVSAAKESEKKPAPDVSTVLLLIAQKLQLLADKNTTLVVTTGPLNVTTHADVTATCSQDLPKRGRYYLEAPLSDEGSLVSVIPLPDGECTVIYTVGQSAPRSGKIEAFNGFDASQTKHCDINTKLCAHKLTIDEEYPFVRITAEYGTSYPTVQVSYSCT